MAWLNHIKSKNHFTTVKLALKRADEIVLADDRTSSRLGKVAESVIRLNGQFEHIHSDKASEFVNSKCKVLVPDGGIYDSNVQRLLVRSGCLSLSLIHI